MSTYNTTTAAAIETTYNTEATMSDAELSILTTAAATLLDAELSILTAEALEEVETIADHLAGLRRCADRLRSLRYVGAGTVVAMAQEPAMRDLLRLHAEIAINIEAGCDLAERGELQVYLGRDK